MMDGFDAYLDELDALTDAVQRYRQLAKKGRVAPAWELDGFIEARLGTSYLIDEGSRVALRTVGGEFPPVAP